MPDFKSSMLAARNGLMALAVFGVAAPAVVAASGKATPTLAHWRVIDAPGSARSGSGALSINDSGDVAGYFEDAAGQRHGFIRSYDGNFTTVDAPLAGSQVRELVDLNNAGEAVGNFLDAQGYLHAMLRTRDGVVILLDLPAGVGSGHYSEAYGINDRGEVVGSFADLGENVRSYLRRPDGSYLVIDPPGIDPATNMTRCNSINDRGAVACNYFSNGVSLQVFHAFNREPDGSVTYVQAPGAGTGWFMGTLDGYHHSLNNPGDLTGQYLDPVHLSFGFVRHRNGSYEQFSAPGAGTQAWAGTFPAAVNGRGNVVGMVTDANYVSHGFARLRNGAMTAIDAPAPGSWGTRAYVINASNQFVGTYLDASGMSHAYLAQLQEGDD